MRVVQVKEVTHSIESIAEREWISYIVVIGDKEVKAGQYSVWVRRPPSLLNDIFICNNNYQ